MYEPVRAQELTRLDNGHTDRSPGLMPRGPTFLHVSTGILSCDTSTLRFPGAMLDPQTGRCSFQFLHFKPNTLKANTGLL